MKKFILVALFLSFISSSINAQTTSSNIKVGDTFTIAKVDHNNYKHIKFPKANFIIKKGGIADYSTVVGKKVKITSIKENKNGSILATIKLTSNKSFFRSHKVVRVVINEAVKNKELVQVY